MKKFLLALLLPVALLAQRPTPSPINGLKNAVLQTDMQGTYNGISFHIKGLADPMDQQDAATKAYVDTHGGGGGGGLTGINTVNLYKGTGAGLGIAAAIPGTDYVVPTGSGAGLSGVLKTSNNFSDLASIPTARANLGLGSAALLSVGTTAGTVAAGDDSRITGAAQKANNLSDLPNTSLARTNLGLGTMATQANTGTSTALQRGNGTGGFAAAVPNTDYLTPTGNGGSLTGVARLLNNLSDLPSPSTARTNLGLAIGTNVQAWNAQLDSISAETTTSFGLGTLTQADATAFRAYIGVGSGSGDVTSNTVTSVDNTLALFNGTSGKAIKLATGSGIPLLTSGVVSIAAAGTDYLSPTGSGTGLTGVAKTANNLSDLGSAATARTNLGLGTIATQAGTGTSTLLQKGNGTGGFAPGVSGTDFLLPNGSGAGLSDVEKTVNKGAANGYASLDGATKIPFVQLPYPAEGTFTDGGSSGSPQAWGAGKTVMSESAALTADRYRTLPLANSFPAGSILTYIDNVTTGSFGGRFRPSGATDTLDGFTAAQWTAATPDALRPFIAGGANPGQGIYQFKTNGTGTWISIYASGRATKIQSPINANKTVTLSVENQTPNAGYVFSPSANGDSGSIPDTPAQTKKVVTGYTLNPGSLIQDTWTPEDMTPIQDNIIVANIISNVHTPPNDGTVDSIRLQDSITAPLTIVWPSSDSYIQGQAVRFYDASGSISPATPVTIATDVGHANGGDAFNSSSTITITEAFANRVFIADPDTNTWTVSVTTGTGNTGNVLGFAGQLTENTTNHTLTWNAVSGVPLQTATALPTGNDTLLINNAQPGMKFEVLIKQPAAGGPVSVTLPTGSLTPSNGLGLLMIDSAANAVTKVTGTYYGTTGLAWDWNAALDLTAAATLSCGSTLGDTHGNWSGNNAVQVARTTNTKYISDSFSPTAGNTTVCKISVPVFKVGTPTGNLTVYLYDNTGTSGSPGAQIVASAQLSPSDITQTGIVGALANPVTFVLSASQSLLTSSTYYFAISGSVIDNSNYYQIGVQNATTGNYYRDDNGTGAWTLISTTQRLDFKTYH